MTIFSKQRLGIDLGTTQTIIYLGKKGIVLREPTVIAKNIESGELVAFGKEASLLQGRTSDKIELIYPIQNGVIHNFTLTKQLLAYFVKKVAVHRFGRPEVVICAPSHITKVERKAVVDAVRDLGVHRAMIVDEPFAASIGANLAIDQARGRLIVDIGGGTTDIALISFGEIIESQTLGLGGNYLNQVISQYIRQEFKTIIGDQTAEKIKIELGNAFMSSKDIERTMLVSGRDLVTGVPREIKVTESLVADALSEVIQEIVTGIKDVLSVTGPELSADILSDGIYLSGGGALIRRLPDRLSQELGLKCQIVDNPLDVVAIGAGRLFDKMQVYSRREEKKNR